MAWDIDPNGHTVQAIFSIVDGEALRVLKVAEIDGDQWRELEEDDAYVTLPPKNVSLAEIPQFIFN